MQSFEHKNTEIIRRFDALKLNEKGGVSSRLNFSWSNWGFGMEPLEQSLIRLEKNGIHFIELHGNHYGKDLGYPVKETKKLLDAHGVQAAGICGMFSKENDLSSANPFQRQAAIDYIRREADFAQEIGARYLLICPGAVGRPNPYDQSEWERSVDTLRLVADELSTRNIRGAIEPIRSAETSLVHTIAQAKAYIDKVNHPGIRHINGDIYHMLSEEDHLPSAILDAGDMLTNLHMADSNRRALGEGCMDIDNIIRALYIIGYDNPNCFVTPEPLGPGGDPYPAQHSITPSQILDELVAKTASYFREREAAVLRAACIARQC